MSTSSFEKTSMSRKASSVVLGDKLRTTARTSGCGCGCGCGCGANAFNPNRWLPLPPLRPYEGADEEGWPLNGARADCAVGPEAGRLAKPFMAAAMPTRSRGSGDCICTGDKPVQDSGYCIHGDVVGGGWLLLGSPLIAMRSGCKAAKGVGDENARSKVVRSW